MRALLWKELRENLKWAALLFIGSSVATGIGLRSSGYSERMYFTEQPWRLTDAAFLGAFAFSAVVSALVLGFLQTALESRGDRWALLVHRPLTRTTIFFSKAAVGLGFYGIVVGVPLIASCLHAAHNSPTRALFTLNMTFPVTALAVAGIAFYFAGMLTGIRNARWYGSRGLGIAAAVLSFAAVLAVPQFSWAVFWSLVVSAVVGTAAWGSFLSGGHDTALPRAGRWALGLTVTAGVLVAVSAVIGVVGGVLDELAPGITWSHFELDRQGRILRITVRDSKWVEISAPDGSAVEGMENQTWERWTSQDSLLARLQPIMELGAEPKRTWPRPYFFDFGVYRISTGIWNWYYVRDRGWIEVYDTSRHETAPHRLVGFVGPDQPTPGPEPKTRFRSEGWLSYFSSSLLVFPDSVYGFSGDGKRFEKVYSAQEGDPVVGAAFVYGPEPAQTPSGEVAVATRKELRVVRQNGEIVWSVDRSLDPSPWPWLFATLSVGRIDGGRHALWEGVRYDAGHPAVARTQHVRIIGTDGKIESENTFLAEAAETAGPCRPSGSRILACVCLSIPFHLALAAAQFDFTWALRSEPFVRLWPWSLVMSGLCALMVFFITGQNGLGSKARAFWTAFAFVLTIPGLLAFLCLTERPVRETCGACGKPRSVAREACEHCQSGWPAPRLDGTEIFA